MEYRVLARKCRPQVFEDVLGQDHVVRTLQNAITQQRIAHAFLFSGPRGVGKTSVARILAKALNCESGPAPVPCNRCVHCLEITNGNAIDVREIDGASNRGIDEIRELRENVKFVPASCRYKIYIIDEVHMLTREAFNALLKTLEEPPAHVIFIFATTETQKVPATILSRCQCFDFRRIALKQITQNLKNIAASDGIRVSDGALSWIAEAGDGSLRDAQSIFDQVISYAGDEITDSAVEEILGRSDRRFLFSLSEAVLARDAGRCLKIIDEAYYAGLDMRYFFQTLLGHFRNLLFTGIAGGKGDLVELPAEEADKLKEQADGQSTDTLQRYLEILMSEEENVRRSQNPRLNLEAVLCRMAILEPLIPIESVITRMESLERRLGGNPTPGTAGPDTKGSVGSRGKQRFEKGDAAKKTGEAAAITPAEEKQAPYRTGPGTGDGGTPDKGWQGYREFVKRHDPALSAKIDSGICLACEEGRLRIGFEKGYLFFDDVMGRKAALAEHCRKFFGRETTLEFETVAPANGGAAPSVNGNGNGRSEKNHRIQEIRREALSHPLVRKILDIFPGAEVRDVRVRETQAPGRVPTNLSGRRPEVEEMPADEPPEE